MLVALTTLPLRPACPSPERNAYFIVSADCFGLHCTRGRDSNGTERHHTGLRDPRAGRTLHRQCALPGVGQRRRADRSRVRDLRRLLPSRHGPPSGPDPRKRWSGPRTTRTPLGGTCLEFPCTRRFDDELIVETAGTPWGDCDAIHDGGAWARVANAPTIIILEEMPPTPEYHPCPWT